MPHHDPFDPFRRRVYIGQIKLRADEIAYLRFLKAGKRIPISAGAAHRLEAFGLIVDAEVCPAQKLIRDAKKIIAEQRTALLAAIERDDWDEADTSLQKIQRTADSILPRKQRVLTEMAEALLATGEIVISTARGRRVIEAVPGMKCQR